MKIVAPSYYKDFKCIADKCKHTCCIGWEIYLDEESSKRFSSDFLLSKHIDLSDNPKIILDENEKCPFLRKDGLCSIIINKGENFLCQICKDHPRFRNYWSGITEIGLGLVCEEAARIILSSNEKLTLRILEDDKEETHFTDDEQFLFDLRNKMLDEIQDTGPKARLKEYLIYRHLPDALYDGMIKERIYFIEDSFKEIIDAWDKTHNSLNELVQIVREWSYDVEYDDEVIPNKLLKYFGKGF